MVDQRVEDLYELNIEGNFDEKLKQITAALSGVQGRWDALRNQFARNATFGRPRQEINKLSGAVRKQQEQIRKLAGEEERLASANTTLAAGYNKLVREQNRLAAARAAEAIALEQARRSADPRIINARAETRAIRRLSGQLEKLAADREFARLAAEAGFKVSADGQRLFDAESIAAERAARANEKLAISRELARRGLDNQGNALVQGPPIPEDIRQQQEAEKRFNRELDNARIVDRTDQLKKQSEEWKRLTGATSSAKKEFTALDAEGKKTNNTFNRISFTFRRLIGIMAAFTIARTVVREFNQMIGSAIRFNAELERNRVGLSGLIAAASDIRDPLGERLSLEQQLQAAQDISIDQMNELRRAAINTTATFEELSNAFSTAVAPGLQAGLDLDEIREITVSISQAATGLGLAQNQLAEEIRSLFQGTITPRNTRIATALGISNEDIRRAKELGTLYEFLDRRFKAISETGKELANTFTGSLNRASDAFKQLLAEASEPLFEQLKGGLKDVREAIFPEGTEGVELFNTDSLEVFRELFEGLADGVDGIRRAFSSIDTRGLADTFSAIGQSLGLLATVLANILSTAFNLATPVITIFAGIAEAINSILKAVGDTETGFGRWVILLGRVLITTKVISSLWARGAALVTLIRVQWGIIRTTVRLVRAEKTAMLVTTTRLQKLVLLIGRSWRTVLLPLTLVATILFSIESVLNTLGSDFSVFDTLADAFDGLNSILDKVLGISEIVPESATKKSSDEARILANSFNEVRSELESLGQTLDRDLGGALGDLQSLRETLGLDNDIALQIQRQSRGLLDFQEKTLSLKNQLDALRAQADETRDALEALGGAQGQDALNTFTGLGTRIAEAREELKAVQEELSGIDITVTPNEETLTRFRQLSERRRQLESDLRFFDEQRTAAAQTLAELDTQRESLKLRERRLATEILTLDNLINDAKAKALRNNEIQLQQLAEIANFNLKQQALTVNADVEAAQAALLAASQTNEIQSELLEAQSRLSAATAERERRALANAQAIRAVQDLISKAQNEANILGTDANTDLIDSYLEQISLIEQQAENEDKILRIKQAQANLEREIAQLRAQGSPLEGIGFGLEQFASSNNSLFGVGERFGQTLADGISSFGATALSEAVAAAFDPSRNFDLREAASGFLFQLANSLLQDTFKFLTSQLIQTLGIETTQGAQQAARLKAIEAAYSQAGSSISNGAGLASSAITSGAATAASTLAGAGSSVAFAMVQGAIQAAAILTAAQTQQSGGAVAGGILGAFAGAAGATGGRVSDLIQSFAVGGTPRRPRGVDPRDTIPAFLRPGEWVIRPEAVQKYGDGLFAALNGLRLNPGALKGLNAAPPKVRSPRPQRSFAAGGRVEASSSARSTALAVNFYDEQVMDRALASGSTSAVRFARRRRSDYRAALGLEAGS